MRLSVFWLFADQNKRAPKLSHSGFREKLAESPIHQIGGNSAIRTTKTRHFRTFAFGTFRNVHIGYHSRTCTLLLWYLCLCPDALLLKSVDKSAGRMLSPRRGGQVLAWFGIWLPRLSLRCWNAREVAPRRFRGTKCKTFACSTYFPLINLKNTKKMLPHL